MTFEFLRYNGGSSGSAVVYRASADLITAVNVAIHTGQPLLVTGDPGTGKSTLARSLAHELGLKLLEFHTGSESRARDVLYRYDGLGRFRDAQPGGDSERAKSIENYVDCVALGKAIADQVESVVLIDEIDKAPRDFPNDLLDIVDRKEFTVPETGRRYTTQVAPFVIITSNGERELPDAFLRRCVYHHIQPHAPDELLEILSLHLGNGNKVLEESLILAVDLYGHMRESNLITRKPSPAELIAWVKLLNQAGKLQSLNADQKAKLAELPYLSLLLKRRGDLEELWKELKRAKASP